MAIFYLQKTFEASVGKTSVFHSTCICWLFDNLYPMYLHLEFQLDLEVSEWQ